MEQNDNKNAIIRPDIKPQSGIIKIVLVIILFYCLSIIMKMYSISMIYLLIAFLSVVILYAKRTIIWMILLYQKYAPESVRRACLYEPTCSNYMLLAIDKYGLLKGITKGIKRLLRCHPPNGGIDNP